MSDFSELCALFNTGVFKEVTFPAITKLSGVTITANLLGGTGDPATAPCDFKFSRTVIVTEAFARRYSGNSVTAHLDIGRRLGSGTAAATVKGTFTGLCTLSVWDIHTWKAFGTMTAFTMTAADVLNLGIQTVVAGSAGSYDVIVRYKEA